MYAAKLATEFGDYGNSWSSESPENGLFLVVFGCFFKR
jgi:hypothetical protein